MVNNKKKCDGSGKFMIPSLKDCMKNQCSGSGLSIFPAISKATRAARPKPTPTGPLEDNLDPESDEVSITRTLLARRDNSEGSDALWARAQAQSRAKPSLFEPSLAWPKPALSPPNGLGF
jgi:hypothetical protein